MTSDYRVTIFKDKFGLIQNIDIFSLMSNPTVKSEKVF